MKKLIYLIIIFLIISCGSSIKETVLEGQMYFAIDTVYNSNQFDSVCSSEKIPIWSSSIPFKDQDGNNISESFYIKQDGTVYRAIKFAPDSIKFLKRCIQK